jgi:peptidoglycan-associated lipoprotein
MLLEWLPLLDGQSSGGTLNWAAANGKPLPLIKNPYNHLTYKFRRPNMSILITKRLASILMPSLAVVFVAAGCGKKAVTTTETPEPQAVATEPIAQPQERAEPEPAKKDLEPLFLGNVHFAFDKFDLTSNARDILANHAQALKNRSEAQVMIEGHCDERGTIEYNLALGEKRAKAVKDYLVALGISPSRLTTISYGKERPVDPGHNEFAWAKNRRAEFSVRMPSGFSEAN